MKTALFFKLLFVCLACEYFGERRGHARLVFAGYIYLDDFDVVLHLVAFFLFSFP